MRLRDFLIRNTAYVCAVFLLLLLLAAFCLSLAGVKWVSVVFFPAWLGALLLLFFCRRQIVKFGEKVRAVLQNDDIEEAALEEAARGGLKVSMLREIFDVFAENLQTTSVSDSLKVEAELHALQNQINPHFLYNTLEIIRGRALAKGAEDVSEMVEALGLQFRYCINRRGAMVFLRDELEHIHNYLLIQRYRFGDRIRYEEQVDTSDERIFRSHLPVLTLQPIVENALQHGIAPKVEGGSIILRVFASERRMHIIVEDDGVGIPEKALKAMREDLQKNKPAERPHGKRSSGIAMSNVNQRIKLYFGEQYGVDLASTEGFGTSVFITLPLMDEEGALA